MAPPSRTRTVALVVLAFVLASASACAPQQPRSPLTPDGVALLVDARRESLPFSDPSEIDDAMRRAMDEQVGRGGSPRERITRLRRWLHEGPAPFEHDPALTIDARTAFRERRGGCMTHAVLFVTLARYLGVEAYYVHALTARQFAERGETLVALTHVAVGFEDASRSEVVDVWIPVDDWRLVRYERIDDAAALSLYYSNLAVEDLHAGRAALAERKFRFLAQHASGVAEVHNNLAAVLVRQRRFTDALAVVGAASARFPRFKPLYTNGFLAASGAGNEALAEDFAARGRELAEDDPVFLVARGVSDYERGRFEQAAESFERARHDQSNSVVVHAWLVRAYVAAGDARSGAAAFRRAWQVAPNDPRLARLADQHPELRAAH